MIEHIQLEEGRAIYWLKESYIIDEVYLTLNTNPGPINIFIDKLNKKQFYELLLDNYISLSIKSLIPAGFYHDRKIKQIILFPTPEITDWSGSILEIRYRKKEISK